LSESSYFTPSITIAGGGGSDILYFASTGGAGVYVLQFQFSPNSEDLSFSNVDICASSILSGVTLISGSKNATDPVEFYLVSYDIVSTVDGGSITFPDLTSLVSLYGDDWSACACFSLSIIRLS